MTDIIGLTNKEMVEKAISLIEEAKKIMDIVMDSMSHSRLAAEYYAYGEFGIKQALGKGNPYDGSLPKIIENMEGEV